MTERRQADRRATGRLQLTGGLTSGHLVNISSTGFAIEIDRGLRVGEYYGFSVRRELEGAPRCGLRSLRFVRPHRFVGRVRWCILWLTIPQPLGEVSPVFRAGIEFDPEETKTPKDTGFIDFSLPST